MSIPTFIDAAVASADFGQPSARKTGRDPRWPYVPIIVRGHPGWDDRQHQVLGRAFATREEAVRDAAEHLDRLRVDLARKLADPRYRGLREQYGLPRELSCSRLNPDPGEMEDQ